MCLICGTQAVVFRISITTTWPNMRMNTEIWCINRTANTTSSQNCAKVERFLIESLIQRAYWKKGEFENLPLPQWTITRQVEDIAGNSEASAEERTSIFFLWLWMRDELDKPQLLTWCNCRIWHDGGGGSRAVKDTDNLQEWLAHKDKCTFGKGRTEMGQAS